MRPHRDLVVVGASAGGISALLTVLDDLPEGLPMSMLVVVHGPLEKPRGLVDVLARRSRYPVAYADDGMRIEHGCIYVAPPDLHLTTDDGRLAVRHGPLENRFRPAVDPLFRSAAESHGPRVIAVVLSGSLDDGTHGLVVVKRHGGIAIVQSEEDALVPQMPASAASAVDVDYVLPASEMGAVIARLVSTADPASSREPARPVGAGADADPPPPTDPTDVVTVLTCPDCGGALWELEDGGVLRYRCHVGHGITGEGLAQTQIEGVEGSLWRAVRALEEHAELKRRMASRAQKGGLDALAGGWNAEAQDAERRADDVRRLLKDGGPRADTPPVRGARRVNRASLERGVRAR